MELKLNETQKLWAQHFLEVYGSVFFRLERHPTDNEVRIVLVDPTTVTIRNQVTESIKPLYQIETPTAFKKRIEPYVEKLQVPTSCNRHADCFKADDEARELWEAEQKKPLRERRVLNITAQHCYNEDCEDCLGS